MGTDVERSGTSPVKVLFAEDNELNADILKDVLERAGFETAAAENGRRALEMFEDSGEFEFDVILMDLLMPGMNGYETTEKIRQLDRNDSDSVKIYAYTAADSEEEKAAAFKCGMNGFISKPIDVNAFIKILNEERD